MIGFSSSCRSATPAYSSRQPSSMMSSENTQRRSTGKFFHYLKDADRGQEYSDSVRHNTADHQVEDDFESMSEVIMSIDVKERCTGCCYYTARDETMYFMEDMKLGSLDMVENCKAQFIHESHTSGINIILVCLHVEPNVVLTSTKTDDAVLERLDPTLNSKSSDDQQSKARKYAQTMFV